MDRNNRYRRPAPPRTVDPFDGVLPVDKPPGPTSHDVVDKVRRTFGFRKVGHGGTLDPQATGVLVLLIGKGTKLSNRFLGSDKVYEGTMRLGAATDTQDGDGNVISAGDFSSITREQLEAEMRKLTGDIMQTPPMVSAVKVNGVPLYKHARKGKEVAREARLVHIYEFAITSFDLPDADFVLRCTKGTYARTLCADTGEALGCGAHLLRLRRTRTSDIDVAECTPLDQLLAMSREELLEKLIPMRTFSAYGSRP